MDVSESRGNSSYDVSKELIARAATDFGDDLLNTTCFFDSPQTSFCSFCTKIKKFEQLFHSEIFHPIID